MDERTVWEGYRAALRMPSGWKRYLLGCCALKTAPKMRPLVHLTRRCLLLVPQTWLLSRALLVPGFSRMSQFGSQRGVSLGTDLSKGAAEPTVKEIQVLLRW